MRLVTAIALKFASFIDRWAWKLGSRLLLLALLLLPWSMVHAQAKITVSGNEQLRPMVQKIAESLNAPIPEWHIAIINEHQWFVWGRSRQLNPGKSAFSILGTDRTFIRERDILTHRQEIRHLLVHELGHLVCNSKNENIADHCLNHVPQNSQLLAYQSGPR